MISIPDLFIFNRNVESSNSNVNFHYFTNLPYEIQIKILTYYSNSYIIQLNKHYSQNIYIIDAFNNFCLNKSISPDEFDILYQTDSGLLTYDGLLINSDRTYRIGSWYNVIRLYQNDFSIKFINNYQNIFEVIDHITQQDQKIYLLATIYVIDTIIPIRISANIYNNKYNSMFVRNYLNNIINTFCRFPVLINDYIACTRIPKIPDFELIMVDYNDGMLPTLLPCDDKIKDQLQQICKKIFELD